MKKYQSILLVFSFLVMLISVVLSQITSESQIPTQKFSSGKELTWDVASLKESYLPLEPIQIKFRATNMTNLSTYDYEQTDFVLYVTRLGKTKKFEQIFPYPHGYLFIGKIKSGESKDLYHFFDAKLLEMFPEYGKYDLKFAVPYFDENDKQRKEFPLDSFSINITQPTGVDKKSFDFLNKYDNSRFLQGLSQQKNNEVLYRKFVEKYEQTPYWDYVVYNLASLYLSRADYSNKGDLDKTENSDKAEIEYEKIRTSTNPVIAERSQIELQAMKVKKDYLRKIKENSTPK
jgi:hypothetical protein